MPNRQSIPTVSQVSKDGIVELIYDAQTRQTALVREKSGGITIGSEVQTESGDILVPYSPANNLIRHECIILPSAVEDHVGKEMLLEAIEAYLHRYVDLSPAFEKIAALYVLLTWVFDAFAELPYLRFAGDFGSGKTRALIALGSIVYKGFFASGASTISPIFHTLDRFGGTLLLDEADLRFSDKTADLVKILNNGTVKGLPVLRSVQNKDREFNPKAFTVYGPKIVAMRSRFRDEALESRFLTEDMGGRAIRADIPIQLPASLKAEAAALRNRLLHFRLTQLRRVRVDPSLAIEGIDHRLNQMGLPLLSLAPNGEARDAIAGKLREKHRQLSAARAFQPKSRIMAVLNHAFAENDRITISIQEIAKQANLRADGLLDPVSARDVGRILRDASVLLRKSHGTIVAVRPPNRSPLPQSAKMNMGSATVDAAFGSTHPDISERDI